MLRPMTPVPMNPIVGSVVMRAKLRRYLPFDTPRLHCLMRLRTSLALLMTLATAPLAAQAPDWASASKETIAHLQTMIRLNTVNPPGNEMQVAKFLDSTLKAAGIETHLFEPAPGRAAFVGRI